MPFNDVMPVPTQQGSRRPAGRSARRLGAAGWAVASLGLGSCGRDDGGTQGPDAGGGSAAVATVPVADPTFTRDVAPIIFANCTTCHRPGESAPFSLITHADVSKRAEMIADVTESRYMPPWLPVAGHGRFIGERRLEEREIAVLRRWAENGAPEGDPEDLPPEPEFTEGWQLGEPDLVAEMPEPFPLPADGRDVYRNFVVPIALDRSRYVRAIEFRTGDTGTVHHAFLLVDETRQSRRRAAEDPLPGYPGMDPGHTALSPGGHFVSWQPGKRASFLPDGMAWRLAKDADLVFQLHLQPTGKPESVRVRVGLHLSDEPPVWNPLKIVLATRDIDIPPGEASHVVETSYQVPVDAFALAVIPHAHYLGKELHGYATLPDGSRRWLIRIDDWDFNWQGDYRFKEPVFLPAGSVIHQRFSFDNSAENPRNPFDPPQRVRYGLQSTDEMAELWIQLIARERSQQPVFVREYTRWSMDRRRETLAQRIAAAEPGPDPEDLSELAKIELAIGSSAVARDLLDRALGIDPGLAEAHYLLGMHAVGNQDLASAALAFERAVAADSGHFASHNGLGNIALRDGDLAAADRHYRDALAIKPEEPAVLSNLALIQLRLGRAADAIPLLERSLEIRPDDPKARDLLEKARESGTP